MARLKRVTNVFETSVELGEEFIFLGSISDLVETEVPAGEWEVVLNGRVLTRDLWEVTYPGEMDVVVLQPLVLGGGQQGDDKSTMRMVALIGVSVASMGVGAALGGTAMAGFLGASATGGMLQTGIVIAGMTATNIIGGMLVNKLIPYPETKDPATFSAYNINPLATQQQGLPLPLWYGNFMLTSGNVINAYRDNKVISSSKGATFYELIMCLGLGPWESITNIAIPGAINAQSIQKDYRLGALSQSIFKTTSLYDTTSHNVNLEVFTSDIASAPSADVVTILATIPATGINKISFDLSFSNGLYYINTDNEERALTIRATLYIADSATEVDGNYTWQAVNSSNLPGESNVPNTTTYESTRSTRRWSYGQYTNRFDANYRFTPTFGPGYTSTMWVEYSSSTNVESVQPDIPAGFISLFTWRYLTVSEPVIIASTSTSTSTTYAAEVKGLFELPFEIPVNLDATVTSYVLKMVFETLVARTLGTLKATVRACNIDTINTYNNAVIVKPLTYPRSVLVNLAATADSNVSSLVPEVSFLGRKVAIWNGSSWSFGYNNNPAWVCYDVLTQPLFADDIGSTTWTTTSPALRYEGMNPSQLDYVSFKAWADFCDELVAAYPTGTEKRYTFNGGFDEISSLWEAALAIAGMSQAWLVWEGSEVSVKLDHTTAVSQLFTMGNYITDSVKESYISMEDRATTIEVEYIESGNDFKSNKFSISESGYADTQKKVALHLRGCTSNSQAYRSGKFELLKNKHLKKTVEFQAPLNAITCTIADVVELQSSVSKGSLGGGRIKSVTSSTVLTLDRDYTFVNGTTYILKVIREDGSLITATLINLNGTTATITLMNEITVLPLDTYAIGESALVVDKLRVLDISQSTDLLCSISCVQYVPEIYDYDDSDIAKIIYTPIADMPEVIISSGTSYAYFDSNKVHRSMLEVMFTKPDSIYYKLAKVYYKDSTDTLANWSFAGTTSGTSFQFEAPYHSTSYDVIVATVNTSDITMNILDAPSASITSALAVLPAVSSLIATPQYLATLATWVHQNNNSVSSYELWMSSSNDRTAASQVYGGVENNALIQIRHDLNYYLWVRPIDSLGNAGDWFPTGSTAGILATSTVLQLDQIDEYNQTAPNPTSVSQPSFS